ncbi:MAG: hypothetical protein ICV64_02435 [Thermoleophilia bacterium]|nr:hypothetical protein [Thermoleophilia bacterium]
MLEHVLGAGKLIPAPQPRPLRLDAEVAYYRADASQAAPAAARAPAHRLRELRVEERDEVDELFLGAARR